ncbi:MAG: aminoglycoside phosphotransferase family protein [Ferruginibacter sp.]|nr:aminoglycoside phosphotransferase family protein [Ferruginibacter sp.]
MLEILKQYNITEFSAQPLGNGLINSTWLITTVDKKFVLQKINSNVFKTPTDIAFNIDLVSNYLQEHYPDYLFTTPIKAISNDAMIKHGNDYYRLFTYIENSHTINVVTDAQQAFEAAKQFGKFTKKLKGFNATSLKTTLPNFHNLQFRFEQFLEAMQHGNEERKKETEELINYLLQQKNIIDEFEERKSDFIIRVTHHDTKISNVLFDEQHKGLCVIDLDTLMPGYFISDVGDMFRTYLSPVNEEETDFTKIEIRPQFYKAIVDGYLSEMEEELTSTEKLSFAFAGKYIIYMQALRFLTDYLNNDIYYGCKYPTHNLVRAGNQIELLKKFIAYTTHSN